jgi:hypothetical protein
MIHPFFLADGGDLSALCLARSDDSFVHDYSNRLVEIISYASSSASFASMSVHFRRTVEEIFDEFRFRMHAYNGGREA